MPKRLIRWALPHKGPPTHLSKLEYGLRLIVFTPLWLITFIPMVSILLFIALGGPLAIAFVIGFSGIASGREIGWSGAQVAELLFYIVSFVTIVAVNLFIRQRYLTPR